MSTVIETPPSTDEQQQQRKLALASIRPANLLSFAPDTPALPLEPLNILIGANGSGKSNLLDAIGLLQAAALGELTDRIVKRGGGVADWIWRGKGAENTAKLEVEVRYPGNKFDDSELQYQLEFEGGKRHELVVTEEWIERDGESTTGESPSVGESMLAMRWSKSDFAEAAYLSSLFSSIRLYRDWSFGRTSAVRNDPRLGVLDDQLAEDASNLGIILNNLKEDDAVSERLDYYLKEFLEDAKRVSTKVVGQHLQYGLSEDGLKGITPSGRLSDGTLRWLSLLAVLLNPNPPPLICLEEPESGLHPQIIQVLAELLIDASERTQIIVTTHSRALVDRFTDSPEYVVVFDKEDDATKMKRLDRKELGEWLEEYSLGPLWARGLLGGTDTYATAQTLEGQSIC
jgi:predicted ATPase